ncbi:MAG: bifunctional riboflavin kinase/FAD synthetase [Dokdonella sp.]
MIRFFREICRPNATPRGSVVCIGAFDGVHRGHRALLDGVRARASERGLRSVAVSFEPIPREFFARSAPLLRLTSARDKIERIADAGIDELLSLRFNAELAAMSPEAFVETILVEQLVAREIWVGADFRFGRARVGDVDMLHAMGKQLGFTVKVFGDFEVDGQRVRSSEIRRLLALGKFDAAADVLGRRFMIGGHVVHGQKLGRQLGYPTANVRLGKRLSSVTGIFAVWVHGVGEQPMPGVASLGIRPTVDGTEPLLEAHLFDFDGDLYGRHIDVDFVAKLRDEIKFDGLDALVVQMDADALQARRILGIGGIAQSRISSTERIRA